MAEKTETPTVPQHLLSDDESRKWKVVDIAVVSPTSVTALLQNNQEWCIDTFDYDENEYQRSKRICLQTNLKEHPLLLSYVHVENKLKHFVCTKTKLHLIDDESESIEKSVSLSAEPSALCVEDNKVYISTNETKTIMFFKLELPTDTSKIYLKDISKHDSIAEFVVHSKNIYVCTKGGKVSSHKETGEKQHDYRNRKSKNYKARSVAVFTPQGKDCNLLLVTWSDNTLYIYSTKSSHDLLDIDLNVPGKIRVTTSCFLMSSEVNDVAVYNMKTVADRGAFKMILVSGSKDKDLSYLYYDVLHDTTTVRALSRNVLIKRKTLRTLVEMYDYSCETNDNLNANKKKARTESDALRRMNEEKEEKCDCLTKQLEAERKTTEELKDEIDRSNKEKGDVAEELENTRSNLCRKEADLSNVKAKLDDARTESNDLRRKNEENEKKCRSLTKRLEAEKKATEEGGITKDTVAFWTENMKTDLRGLIDGILDDTMKLTKQKNDVTEELEITKSTLTKKKEDRSQIQVELDAAISKKMDLEKTVTKSEELYRIIQAKEREIQKLRMRLKKAQTEVENAKTQVTILQDRKQELEKSLSREQERSEELQKLLLNANHACSGDYDKTTAQLEDAGNRLKIEYESAAKKQTLLSDLNERIKELEFTRKKMESQQKKLKDNLVQEKRKVTREERSRVQLIERIKEQEGIRTALKSQQKKLKDNLVRERGKVTREERSRVQLNKRIKALEFTRKKMESQQKKLKDKLVQEKGKVTREERSRVQLNERIKELEFTRKKMESQQKKLIDNLVQEKRKVTREERSRVQLNERIKEIEFTRKKLESQHKKLKDNLVQEKRKVTREERSRVQMVAKLNKVEERNKKLEDAMMQLKERLLAEGMTTKKMQTASPKILETQEDEKRIPRDENIQANTRSIMGNINRLGEGLSKSKAVLNELEKSTVEQEADNMQLTLELSNVSDDTILQNGQDSVSLMVESAFDEMEEEVMKLEEKIEKLEGSLSEKEASFKALYMSNSKLSEECERLSKEVALARFLSDSSKFGASQRHDRDPYWFNDADPAIFESMDSGVATSNLETDDCLSGLFTENLDQFCPELKVAVTVSSKGTQMLIPDTGVELYVPGGSLLSRQLIEIKVIDFDNDKFNAVFSLDRNSSVAVQLLPNKATLRWPARLRLPHCLRLKANFQELKSHVKIYRSDHAPGQDIQWEHDPELKYELKEDCCIIYVKKFCSLRYDVIDEAIDATKVTVFTSGKQHGTSTELAVGYHVDLPGRRELLLTMNNDMKIFKAKPFEFVKESTDTLQVHLTTAVSRAQSYEKTTTEVNGKLSVFEAAAKIGELPLDRPQPIHLSVPSHFEGNQHISTAMLKVSETVSNKGTTMRILDTGIELNIPPNALKGYRYIEMSVIPFGTLDEPISTFSSNSSVIVELLPNRATLNAPVRLSLPHCLKLKKGCSKDSVKVYLSHHEKDQKPFWEELPDAKYELKADHCVIYLTSFCWVKYEIDNNIVVAKRIKVYTATRGMEQNDQIAEVEVGYFIDMPGRAENLRANVDLKISQCKPLLFFKEGNLPLQIFHIKVLPMFWNYSTPESNPKVIQYKSIADSVDTSLPFVFEKQDASKQKPFVMFRVSQGNEEVEINIRL